MFENRFKQKLLLSRLLMTSICFRAAHSLSIVSWNVNGIKSFLKHDLQHKLTDKLFSKHPVDILCLQETKLQEIHVNEVRKELCEKLGIDEEDSAWNCSRARKGYSGTALINLNKDNRILSKNSIHFGIGCEEGDLEGRALTLKTPNYCLINVYVPNAGTLLKRLNYRINKWDEALASYINRLKIENPEKPIFLVGDLNVAHEAIDFYNPHEIRTKKQPGTSPEEQASFRRLLIEKCEMIDSYRHIYPDSQTFSYFNARMGENGRKQRLGMRLDYCMVYSPNPEVLDVSKPFIEDQISHPLSDHCPVGLHFKL